MDTSTPTLISVLRDRMQFETPDERVSIVRQIMDGYCFKCGYALNTPAWLNGRGGYCNCDNDD